VLVERHALASRRELGAIAIVRRARDRCSRRELVAWLVETDLDEIADSMEPALRGQCSWTLGFRRNDGLEPAS
jgi:hypothetical protein